MKTRYEDFFEIASMCFLTEVLPAEAMGWSDKALQIIIEATVSEAYQDWHWANIFRHIDETAYSFYTEIKK